VIAFAIGSVVVSLVDMVIVCMLSAGRLWAEGMVTGSFDSDKIRIKDVFN